MTSEALRNAGSASCSCHPARNTSGAPLARIASHGCSPSHSPGWPPSSTSAAGRSPSRRARPNARTSRLVRLTSVNRPTASSTGRWRAARSRPRCSAPTPPPRPAATRAGRRTRCSRQCAARSMGAARSASGSKPFGLTTQRAATSSPSRRSTRGSWLAEIRTTRSARAAQRRIRAAHASACAHDAGAPSAIRSSMSSSVPCRWATIGTSGATRAAASWSGVRWWSWRTSKPAAPTRTRAADQAATCAS